MKVDIEDRDERDQDLRFWLLLIPESPAEELALATIRDRLDRRCVPNVRVGLTQMAVRLPIGACDMDTTKILKMPQVASHKLVATSYEPPAASFKPAACGLPLAARRSPLAAPRPTPKQIQLLHILPARLGWDDQERRGYLQLLTGKDSSKDLTRREATLVIDRLKEQVEGLAVATRRMDGATRFELAFAAKLRGELGAARFDGLARRIGRPRSAKPATQGEEETAVLGEMPGRKVRAVIEAAKAILKREVTG